MEFFFFFFKKEFPNFPIFLFFNLIPPCFPLFIEIPFFSRETKKSFNSQVFFFPPQISLPFFPPEKKNFFLNLKKIANIFSKCLKEPFNRKLKKQMRYKQGNPILPPPPFSRLRKKKLFKTREFFQNILFILALSLFPNIGFPLEKPIPFFFFFFFKP